MKKIFLIAFIILSIAFLGTTPCYSSTYYIDFEIGSDSNNGISVSTPFKHCPFDSRFSGSCSPTAGDNYYFKRGVVYEAGTSQTGNLMSVTTGGSSNSTRVTFGAYGSGARPVITGGKQLDETQFSQYAGSVYRATNSSLGLTGVNGLGMFEADKYNKFNPRADYYNEESSADSVNDGCEFYQSGTGASDYLYIYTSTGVSPSEMDLYAVWMDRIFYSSAADFFTFENMVIQGADINGIYATGQGVSIGYNLILDNVAVRWCGGTGIYSYYAPVWMKNNSEIIYCMKDGGDSGSALTVATSDRASLLEDSKFARTRNFVRFYGNASYTPVVRRCLFMGLHYYDTDWDTEQHGLLVSTDNMPLTVYRCIFYDMGNDFMFDNGVNYGKISFFNNTVFDDRPQRFSGRGIQANYTNYPNLDYKNNVVVCRKVISTTYQSYDVDYQNSDMDYNFIVSDLNRTVVWLVNNGEQDNYTLSVWREYSKGKGYEKDTNSGQLEYEGNLLSIFQSVTYGDPNFLKPKAGGPLIDAGTTITIGENEKDYDGNTVTGTYDIGAFEYAQGEDEKPHAPSNLEIIYQ